MFTLYKRFSQKPSAIDRQFDSMEEKIHIRRHSNEPLTHELINEVYNDTFIEYSGLGGYPIIFVDNCDVLCADCAKHRFIMENRPITMDVYWEGQMLECEDCGCIIESAYGDPDEWEDE